MSFQLTILKVLDGQPDGRARLSDLKHYIAILTTSGPDWPARMKRLAARAPQLDIFGQYLVKRDEGGWYITDAGRAFLAQLAAAPDPTPVRDLPAPVELALPPLPEPPPAVLLVAPKRRTRHGRRRTLDRTRRSA